jgi:RecA-family ATPase
MDNGTIAATGPASNLGDYLGAKCNGHAAPLADRLGSAAAIAFLKQLDPTGRHNLVAIDPIRGGIEGRTFEPGAWPEMAAWIAERDGKTGLYVSVNEPREGAPHKKLSKRDISGVRAVAIDVDLPGENADAEVQRLKQQIRNCFAASPPTLLVDSGGGIHAYWLFARKLDTAQHWEWAEAQSRGLSVRAGGDHTQSVDHLLRLPGTLNLPNGSKRAKGRVPRQSRLIEADGRRYTPDELAAAVAPISAPPSSEHESAAVQEAIAELERSDIWETHTLEDAPAELRARFQSALIQSPALTSLWGGRLNGKDRSGSAYRAALAGCLARLGGFSLEDYGHLARAWEFSVQLADDREQKLTARALARDWVRCGLPDSQEQRAERYFEAPAEAVPSSPPSLAWINPVSWAGKPIPPREWEVEGWIPRGEVTLLYGPGGSGKTLIAQQYATCATAGLDWFGQKTRPGRVMCFFSEDSEEELHRRQADLNRAMGVSFADLGNLRLVSLRCSDNRLALWDRSSGAMKPQDLFHRLVADARAFRADVVILDTLADVYGGNEIDRGQVTAFVRGCLGRITTELDGGTVIGLAHPSQSGESAGTGTSGSTAWNNAVRSRLYLRYVKGAEKGPLRELEGMKLNYGPRGQLLKVRWARGAFELVGASARQEGAGASPAPKLDDVAEEAVVAALQAEAGTAMSFSVGRNSIRYAPRLLKRRQSELLNVCSEDEVVSALQRLEKRGAIREVTLPRDPSGNRRVGIEVVLAKLVTEPEDKTSVFE